jgi:RNA polymerase sigma-70 factor (ECF subfamily)
MASIEVEPQLGEIETIWSDILQARSDEPDDARAARCRLVYRYTGAVRRYLLDALRDPDAADELAQEFALRVLRGDFSRADPCRGRFRDFVRTAARNLFYDHFRRHKARSSKQLPLDDLDPADPRDEGEEADRRFLEIWREQLLQRARSRLAAHQRRTGRPFHTILGLRADHPDHTSLQLAEIASALVGRRVTGTWVRQTLRRARAFLVDFLLDEVDATLVGGSPAELEQELIDLDLLAFCREGLRRRVSRSPQADRRGPAIAEQADDRSW